MRGLVAVVVLCGCNQVFGLDSTKPGDAPLPIDADLRPDIDNDGIKDPDDLCIAPPSDVTEDADGDLLPNAMDPCPFVHKNAGTDPDMDGLNLCDPFATLAGDRNRCTMTFRNLDMNTALWAPRGDAWTTDNGFVPAEGDTSIVARVALDDGKRAATYEVRYAHTADTVPVPASSSVTLLVRTGTHPTDDIGCRITRLSDRGVLTTVGGPILQDMQLIIPNTVVLQATVEPEPPAAQTCGARLGSRTETVTARRLDRWPNA